MFHIVLHEPEIPQNAGNIIRLCANTGTTLHLIHPMGFTLDDRRLRRAGLDYHEYATLVQHRSIEECLADFDPQRVHAVSTRARRTYTECRFIGGDVFVFGAETSGLPADVLDGFPPERLLRIPMHPVSRSLNLANAAAVVIYEAWRQNGFAGAQGQPAQTVARILRCT
jgi:tRNA (cytidine/uridine-2'-O-)-methyltransferase